MLAKMITTLFLILIPILSNLKFLNSFNALIFSSLTLGLRLVSWWEYNICFCKAVGSASGLVFCYKLVDLAVLQVLTTFFTTSSNYNLKKAATFVNIREGLSALLAFIYNKYAFLSHLKLIICSAVSFICGLLVLHFPASHKFPESKTDIFNMIGVVLLAVGEPGLKTSLTAFLDDQLRAHEPEQDKNDDRVKARRRMWWLVAGFFSVPFAMSVPAPFTFSGLITGGALILFSLGIRDYHRRESPDPGRRLSVFSVVKASLQKRKIDYPTSPDQFYCNEGKQMHLSPQIKILRWLDKSAIIEPPYLTAEEPRNAGRLCTVKEVRQIKLLFKMIPLWINFVVLGLLVSTGNTFFPEQGNNLIDANLYTILLTIGSTAHVIPGLLLKSVVCNWDKKTKKRAQILKIRAGMMLSVLCCAVAWRVEVHRLNIVNKEGLLHKPDNVTIPMSILWLAPQFILLGLMQGLATDGLNEFVTYEFPELTQEYVKSINELVIGIGSILNIVCVQANGSLFSETLNLSRLDKYYKTLTVVSFINHCIYFFISTIYTSDEGAVAVDEITQTSDAANGDWEVEVHII